MGTVNKSYTVSLETFDNIFSYRLNPEHTLKWECLFVLPPWLKVWWDIFGKESTLYLCSVRHKGELIGIAPLLLREGKARFIGDADVCDYQDFIIAPGRGQEFFDIFIKYLRHQGIKHLDLSPLRAESTVLTDLVAAAKRLQCEVLCEPVDTGSELKLPNTWEGYLHVLTGKQRHEIRRKMRRLHEAAHVDYRVVEDVKQVREQIDTFLALFGSNRPDKAAFMSDRMAFFFRTMAEAMAEAKILKLFFLDLDSTPAAGVMCFDYGDRMHLYNNGYDHRFSSLSVALISKVLSIKESIQRGMDTYDFLRGDENYKYHLGGRPVQFYSCRVNLA